jgi:heterodisulfide reductase subunit B
MKSYAYYPGCSLETMAASYHVSAVETANRLGVTLEEIEDWNCCGATPYSHIDELLADTLCARNLALAEKQGLDLVAPCSGCYKNLYFANAHIRDDADLAEHMNYALEADDLSYSGSVEVKHLMDVFGRDVGLDAIRERVTRPLAGLKVAPYYGCQIVRPRHRGATLQDTEGPTLFEDLMSAIGATPVNFPARLRCCGGSLIATNRKAALDLLRTLLESAVSAGADVIATVCPLCQINLECYEQEVNREFGVELSIPILYFTQLMGLALGVAPKRLGIGTEIIAPTAVLACHQANPASGEQVPL